MPVVTALGRHHQFVVVAEEGPQPVVGGDLQPVPLRSVRDRALAGEQVIDEEAQAEAAQLPVKFPVLVDGA